MKKQQLPPLKEPMYNNGIMNTLWVRWFTDLSKFQDNYRKTPDEVYASDVTLTTRDFGKTILMDVSISALTCRLMDISLADLYCWITIYRKGREHRLTIVPPAGVKIEYGSPGGRIWNDETKRLAANVTLEVIDTDQIGIIGATGVWNVA